MRLLLSLLIVIVSFQSCQGQHPSKQNEEVLDSSSRYYSFEEIIRPWKEQLVKWSNINEALLDSTSINENISLHANFLKFRAARLNQHALIDSIRNLVQFDNDRNYLELQEVFQEVLLRNHNFRSIQLGAEGLQDIADSIKELEGSDPAQSLLLVNEFKPEELSYLLLYQLQLNNIVKESVILQIIEKSQD